MRKVTKLPRDEARARDESPDGLPARDGDVEGHKRHSRGDDFHRGPSTGGDAAPRRPWGTGEVTDESDVEGHARLTEDDFHRGPGTGGDAAPRRPWGTGELTDDDVDGHPPA